MRHATSTDYRHPYRPRIVRIANRVLAGLSSVSLDPRDVIAAARRRTGLGDPDAETTEALTMLLRSIDAEAELHPLGRRITRARIVSMLATRMRLDALARSELGRIVRPIVIVGLPRTGTTLLHRLLASDTGRIRSLASWEALMPVSAGGRSTTLRTAAAKGSEIALRWMAPDFFAVHPIDARAPEEEILLLDLAFRSTVAESTMHVPTYAAWLEGADQGPAYRTMALALQALQAERTPGGAEWRWVLKTPHHLEWLAELPKVLDDPLLVWTHRDPHEVVPSFCSMLAHARGILSDRVDPHAIGRGWLRKGQRMVERALAARAALGEDRFLDVRYEDLIRDPLAVAQSIQARVGLPATAQSTAAMRDGLAAAVKDRHGVHRYRLSDFALDEATVADAFAGYRARFDLQ